MFLAEETVSPKALRLLVRTLAYEGVCIHEQRWRESGDRKWEEFRLDL